MSQRHKWADVIIAWANGETIEWRVESDPGPWSIWREFRGTAPQWHDDGRYEYRVKPKDIVYDMAIFWGPLLKKAIESFSSAATKNVRYTFDAETHKLKSVELIQ